MASIILQFCAFNSAMGQIIKWGTQGSVNHVDIVLPDWHHRHGDLLGAQHQDGLGGMPSGVQIRPFNYGDSCGMTNRKRITLETTDTIARAAYEWALSMIGTPYDTKAIEGITIGQDWSREDHLICSGTAMGMLTQPQPPFNPNKPAKHWRIWTPEEVMLFGNAFAPVVDV